MQRLGGLPGGGALVTSASLLSSLWELIRHCGDRVDPLTA